MRRLDETVSVFPRQILPDDLPALAARGIRILVNNRPDGEEPGQPTSAQIEAAARAAGLDYVHIPVVGGLSVAEGAGRLAEALDRGPALLFCRSGTRSTSLWALARASRGAEAESLIGRAAEAGYDLNPLRIALTRLGSGALEEDRPRRPSA